MTETLLWLSLVLQHTLLAFLAVSENLFSYTWPVILSFQTIVSSSRTVVTTVVVCKYDHEILQNLWNQDTLKCSSIFDPESVQHSFFLDEYFFVIQYLYATSLPRPCSMYHSSAAVAVVSVSMAA